MKRSYQELFFAFSYIVVFSKLTLSNACSLKKKNFYTSIQNLCVSISYSLYESYFPILYLEKHFVVLIFRSEFKYL